MANKTSSEEKMYLGKIINPKKNFEGIHYAVHHIYKNTGEVGAWEYINYELETRQMVGYLEGATAIPRNHVQEVINGIPDFVRAGHLSHYMITPLSHREFQFFIRESGLERRCKEGRIKIVNVVIN